MFEFFKNVGNYNDRKLGRHTSDSGIEVSTAFTYDEGYETALIDKNGVHVVERYKDKETALEGHTKWMKFADTGVGEVVTCLGTTELGLGTYEIKLSI